MLFGGKVFILCVEMREVQENSWFCATASNGVSELSS